MADEEKTGAEGTGTEDAAQTTGDEQEQENEQQEQRL